MEKVGSEANLILTLAPLAFNLSSGPSLFSYQVLNSAFDIISYFSHFLDGFAFWILKVPVNRWLKEGTWADSLVVAPHRNDQVSVLRHLESEQFWLILRDIDALLLEGFNYYWVNLVSWLIACA